MPTAAKGGPRPFPAASALPKMHQSCPRGPKEFSFKAGSISKIILTEYQPLLEMAILGTFSVWLIRFNHFKTTTSVF